MEALAVVHQLEVVAWNLLLLKLLVVVQESSVVRLTGGEKKNRNGDDARVSILFLSLHWIAWQNASCLNFMRA